MYLSELIMTNFRKFGEEGRKVEFNKGFNLFVGENDSGKTTVIDAIKFVLGTHSNDYSRIEIDDFHLPTGSETEDERATILNISCKLSGITLDEAKHLIEWLSFEKVDGKTEYVMFLQLTAKRQDKRIYYDVKTGMNESTKLLNNEARNRIRATYLKPLRDANTELAPKRNSRLSQILSSHAAFEIEDNHFLIEIFNDANKKIKNYFEGKNDDGTQLPDQQGKNLLEDLNEYLNRFSNEGFLLESGFKASDLKLRYILEKLSLELSSEKPGLGSQNLLFIATELLLLRRDDYEGLSLALIEEIEAHLHTQAQLRLIEFLQELSETSNLQLILTTHSTALASKIKLENLFICNNDKIFSMRPEETELQVGDYLFLERFLDSTKADLFFSQGVIMVEGDAENLLLPTIAKIIDKPLSKYGVSVLNVGSTAFMRYSSIFKRKEIGSGIFDIPVACITDLDLNPNAFIDEQGLTKEFYVLQKKNQEKIKESFDGQNVKTFVSPYKTLEHDIALSSLSELLLKAVLQAKKIQNSDKYGLTEKKNEDVENEVEEKKNFWKERGYNIFQIADNLYNEMIMSKTNKISKAIIAQCLATLIEETKDKQTLKKSILQDENLAYIVNAIKYVTSSKGNV
ncbi:ATP-dependent nuclease [Solibacillus ferritrahens]|uniref:ATP-dependent nuclease n=1 Tax=Solibacillus ferritrahens TaxID=3098620 RepID=UPI00300851D8